MTYIIGIDPGKSLGIAIMNFPRLATVYQGEIEHGIVWLREKLTDYSDIVDRDLSQPSRIYVALEKFIITPGTGRKRGATQTSALVGRMEEIVSKYPYCALYKQSVSDASRFSNTLLRKLNLYVSPSQVGCKDSNDANSAVRHILLCLARNRADLFTKLIGDIEL